MFIHSPKWTIAGADNVARRNPFDKCITLPGMRKNCLFEASDCAGLRTSQASVSGFGGAEFALENVIGRRPDDQVSDRALATALRKNRAVENMFAISIVISTSNGNMNCS